jgi:hypothetical protein
VGGAVRLESGIAPAPGGRWGLIGRDGTNRIFEGNFIRIIRIYTYNIPYFKHTFSQTLVAEGVRYAVGKLSLHRATLLPQLC